MTDLDLLEQIALQATQGQWHYGATICANNDVALAIVKENLDATERPISEFYEVFVDNGRLVHIYFRPSST